MSVGGIGTENVLAVCHYDVSLARTDIDTCCIGCTFIEAAVNVSPDVTPARVANSIDREPARAEGEASGHHM